MQSSLTKIEFRFHPNKTDIEDLSQECTAYLKTKQFMADRIYQQQEEIDMLKQNVMYHSGKHIQMNEMLSNITEQLEIIRPNVNNIKSEEAGTHQINYEDSNEFVVSNELTTSFVCDDNFENQSCGNNNNNDNPNKNKNEEEIKVINKATYTLGSDDNFISPVTQDARRLQQLNEARKENVEYKKELEKFKIQLLEQRLELNKIKTDKFILFNELNEVIQSIRRVDLDKLNNFVKTNSNAKNFNKIDMPSAKGLKYNVLSAQCQLGKIIKSDLISKKLKIMEEDPTIQEEDKAEDEKNQKNDNDLLQMESYLNLLKKTEEEFNALLDKKLSKRSKSFNF